MDYRYENLDENRFQHFCQSLLVTEFPDLQCFPVGQPDGGRDAIVYADRVQDDFVVFQVKYVRNPQSVKDPHKWLVEIMAAEAPKVKGCGYFTFWLHAATPSIRSSGTA